MTPMLILLFGDQARRRPSRATWWPPCSCARSARSSTCRKGTVNLQLVGWMVLGSVPAAFVGAYLLHLVGDSSGADDQRREGPRRGPAGRRRGHGAALRARPALRPRPRRRGPRPRGAPAAHRRHRHGRRLHRRHDLGGVGLADDRAAAVPLPDARRQPARGHRPDPGRPADHGRRARRAGLRPHRVLRHHLARSSAACRPSWSARSSRRGRPTATSDRPSPS